MLCKTTGIVFEEKLGSGELATTSKNTAQLFVQFNHPLSNIKTIKEIDWQAKSASDLANAHLAGAILAILRSWHNQSILTLHETMRSRQDYATIYKLNQAMQGLGKRFLLGIIQGLLDNQAYGLDTHLGSVYDFSLIEYANNPNQYTSQFKAWLLANVAEVNPHAGVNVLDKSATEYAAEHITKMAYAQSDNLMRLYRRQSDKALSKIRSAINSSDFSDKQKQALVKLVKSNKPIPAKAIQASEELALDNQNPRLWAALLAYQQIQTIEANKLANELSSDLFDDLDI